MPYAPGITYQGGELLARGLEQLGEGLSAGLRQYQQNKQESDALAAAGEQIVKTRLKHGLPVDAAVLEKFSKGSLGAKRGLVGQLTADTWKEIEALDQAALRQMQSEIHLLQKEQLAANIARVTGENEGAAAERAGSKKFNEFLAGYLNTPELIRRPATREMIIKIAAESGVPVEKIPDKLFEQFEPQFVPGTMKPIEGMPNYGFVIQNRSGAGSPIPLPTPPSVTTGPGTTAPILDENGQPLGRMVFDGKAWRRLPEVKAGLSPTQELEVRARIDKLKANANKIALQNRPDLMRALREEVQTLEALLPERSIETSGQSPPSPPSPPVAANLFDAFQTWKSKAK